ncbi:MAG: hypothetical protein H6641_22395 [Caldilineaceae bacterium]|nr:hypothetical protein [Caldilineaceae bacterium]
MQRFQRWLQLGARLFPPPVDSARGSASLVPLFMDHCLIVGAALILLLS